MRGSASAGVRRAAETSCRNKGSTFAARRIINAVRGINRVGYDITSKPPGMIEWE